MRLRFFQNTVIIVVLVRHIFNEIQNNILVKQNQSFLFNNNKGKNIYYVEYLFLGLKRKYLCVK